MSAAFASLAFAERLYLILEGLGGIKSVNAQCSFVVEDVFDRNE